MHESITEPGFYVMYETRQILPMAQIAIHPGSQNIEKAAALGGSGLFLFSIHAFF
jgi:hypothetical protein